MAQLAADNVISAPDGWPLWTSDVRPQAARDWGLAARMLAGRWVSLVLDGQAATAHELLTAFPAGMAQADAECTALLAADELERGSLSEAGSPVSPGRTGIWSPAPPPEGPSFPATTGKTGTASSPRPVCAQRACTTPGTQPPPSC